MTYRAFGSTISVTNAPNAANAQVEALALDRFVVVWQDGLQTGGDTSGLAIRARVYDGFGVAASESVVINNYNQAGDQKNPEVLTLKDGTFIIGWQEDTQHDSDMSGSSLRFQRYEYSGALRYVSSERLVNTTTTGDQTGLTLARNGSGDGFVAAWVDGSGALGTSYDIRFQLFDGIGNKVGGEFVAGQSTAGVQSKVASIDTPDGFVLAWYESTSPTDGRVVTQRYLSSGAAVGAEQVIALPTGTSRFVEAVDLVRLNDAGDYGVSFATPNPAWPITFDFLQAFHADGTPHGDAYKVTDSSMYAYTGGVSISANSDVGEGAAFASTTSLIFDQGGQTFDNAALGTTELTEQSTIRGGLGTYLGQTITDGAMLSDGRIVTVGAGNGSAVAFNITDGRGPNVSAFGGDQPVVLIGADAGGDRNNVLVGTEFNDALYGLGGDDYLYGFGGNDTLAGGEGLDVLIGGAGSDTLLGGGGFNYLYGDEGADQLYGGGSTPADIVAVMYGGAGQDTLYGGAGTNYFYGGSAADYMVGGSGLNIFIASGDPSGDTITNQGGGQMYVYGSNGGDRIYAGAQTDVFLCGTGDDTIYTGGGVDYVWGGGGADSFNVSSAAGNVAVINDFDVGGVSDIIKFSQFGSFTAYSQIADAMYYAEGINTTIITAPQGGSVWIIGVNPTQLNASDFGFF